ARREIAHRVLAGVDVARVRADRPFEPRGEGLRAGPRLGRVEKLEERRPPEDGELAGVRVVRRGERFAGRRVVVPLPVEARDAARVEAERGGEPIALRDDAPVLYDDRGEDDD